MSRASQTIVAAFAIVLCVVTCSAQAANYRGAAAGWPAYANGAYPANQVNYGGGPAYYVARPATTAYYPGSAPAAVRYVPVNAAYGNPAYFAAYRGMPAANRAPAQVAAYYPGTTTAYYAPAAAAYAPNYSYAVSPAGSNSAGSEASIAYAQPMALNYVPQRVTYRPAYAATPVYAYRPVTAYDPILAQPTTCYQPAPAPTCQSQSQPQCRSFLSRLNPFNWFRGCRSNSGCGAQPTVAYCTSGGAPASSCGQPYYPTAPVIPYVPAPITTSPPIYTTPIPSGPVPPAGPRVPSPPTRLPGTFVPGSTFVPADTRPSLSPTFTPPPGSSTTPLPGSSFPTNPGGTFTPTTPGGSFPTAPGPTPGGFGSASNYPPSNDPYSNTSSGVIRAPEAGRGLPPGVSVVPDLDAKESPRALNRAPQLVDPRDKSAKRTDARWAVVPAVWPTSRGAQSVQASVNRAGHTTVGYTPTAADYDDRGWQSAR